MWRKEIGRFKEGMMNPLKVAIINDWLNGMGRGGERPLKVFGEIFPQLKEEVGWMPQTGLKEGVSRFVNWLKNSRGS
jgi:nucleoside-diphosphate-sugar epimerase